MRSRGLQAENLLSRVFLRVSTVGYDLKTKGNMWTARPYLSGNWSPNGEEIAFSESPSNRLHIVDATNGELRREFGTPMDVIGHSYWSPDASKIAVFGTEAMVVDAQSGKVVVRLMTKAMGISSAAWSHSGDKIAVGSSAPVFGSGFVDILDAQTGRHLRRIARPSRQVADIIWTKSDALLAYTDVEVQGPKERGIIVFCEPNHGRQVYRLSGPDSNMVSVRLLSGGAECAGLVNKVDGLEYWVWTIPKH